MIDISTNVSFSGAKGLFPIRKNRHRVKQYLNSLVSKYEGRPTEVPGYVTTSGEVLSRNQNRLALYA